MNIFTKDMYGPKSLISWHTMLQQYQHMAEFYNKYTLRIIGGYSNYYLIVYIVNVQIYEFTSIPISCRYIWVNTRVVLKGRVVIHNLILAKYYC